MHRHAIGDGRSPARIGAGIHQCVALDGLQPSLSVRAEAGVDGVAEKGARLRVAPVDDRGLDAARQHVFRRLRTLGITDLEAHIKFEETYTPVSWSKRYNLMKGSTHGLSHRLTQMAYFRPSNRHARYQNLYFVGASTHPGAGVPTAMVSGRLVSERIREEQQ